jgi:hypothetical protein
MLLYLSMVVSHARTVFESTPLLYRIIRNCTGICTLSLEIDPLILESCNLQVQSVNRFNCDTSLESTVLYSIFGNVLYYYNKSNQ